MLRPGVSSTDAKLRFDRDDSDLRKLRTEELEVIEAKYGRFCKVLVIPPRTRVRSGYNESIGKREIVERLLSPKERADLVDQYRGKATGCFGWLQRRIAYLLIAQYIDRGGKILTTRAIHYGTAPYKHDGRGILKHCRN
jgi:hypothetical protein